MDQSPCANASTALGDSTKTDNGGAAPPNPRMRFAAVAGHGVVVVEGGDCITRNFGVLVQTQGKPLYCLPELSSEAPVRVAAR